MIGKNKCFLAGIILMSLCTVATGCWSYKELDEMAIVAGMAVDKVDDKFLLTVEVVSPQLEAEGAKFESVLFDSAGRAVFDGIRNIIRKSGKKLFWSHAKILIISKTAAEEGLVPVLDWVGRDVEVRGDMWILVSEEETAQEILKGEKGLYDILSFQIQDVLWAEEHLARFPPMELWEFLNDIGEEGGGAVATGVYLVPHNGGKIPQVSGSALFKGARLVGWLDDIETRDMLWIRDEVQGGLVIVEEVGKEQTKVSMEIFNSRTKVKPAYEDGKLRMKINIDLEMGIAELSTTKDYFTEEGITFLENATERILQEQIKGTIRKVQREYGTDVFKFGQTIKREMPDRWRQMKEDWNDLYPGLDTEVNVKAKIKSTALMGKSIQVGE
ncbi:Ger(x)C family spore germination protein [Geosporobacter ferrireducens]|uniref:Ger(x)C family spore germination protein n=1 Tax=Geosporobacter ferrireducens TaxID=1424294 RepID=UPI001F30F1B9|nr:Ger(x)C family spore germination protein [Geosporobacter ferrireducens]